MSDTYQTVGDVTNASVVTEKVTVKIGDAGNWWRGCRDKNRFKKANIPVCLVLFEYMYPLSLESEIRPIKCKIMSSLYQ